MATLSGDARKELNAEYMRTLSAAREPITLLKHELEDTFAIVDTELESVVETLRTKITSKAQASLDEAAFLKIFQQVITARQVTAVRVKEADAKEIEVSDGKR